MRSAELKIDALSERRKTCFISLKCYDNSTPFLAIDKTCNYLQKFLYNFLDDFLYNCLYNLGTRFIYSLNCTSYHKRYKGGITIYYVVIKHSPTANSQISVAFFTRPE